MQTLTRTYMVVIEDFVHTTTINENVNYMKLTHLLSKISIILGPPLYIYLYVKRINNPFRWTH